MLFCSINSPLWRISSPKNGCQPDFYQEFDPYLGSLNVGEVMSQSTVQAKLCAGKNRIGSSIQAQSPGEVMGQRWRSYDLSDSTGPLPGQQHQPRGEKETHPAQEHHE